MPEKKKMLRKLSNGTTIRFESRDKVESYPYELQEILDIIGHPDAFITDRSTTGDFFDGDEDEQMNAALREISDHFGINGPAANEFLVDIAERARKARKNQ